MKKTLFYSTLALTLCGCHRTPTSKADPYESVNRVTFAFNQGVDHIIARPVTQVYDHTLPHSLRHCISNAYDNIHMIRAFPNDLIQGKFRYALLDGLRFITNSTIGMGGLFDVATSLGIPKHENDTGRTLAYYSKNKHSPYFIIPLFGPSTMRDAFGRIGDYALDPMSYAKSESTWRAYTATRFADLRSRVMPMNSIIDDAIDPYVAMRNAYLQSRIADIASNETDTKPGVEQEPADIKPLDASDDEHGED